MRLALERRELVLGRDDLGERAFVVVPVVARVDERQGPAQAVVGRRADDRVPDADDGEALADLVLKRLLVEHLAVDAEVRHAREVGVRQGHVVKVVGADELDAELGRRAHKDVARVGEVLRREVAVLEERSGAPAACQRVTGHMLIRSKEERDVRAWPGPTRAVGASQTGRPRSACTRLRGGRAAGRQGEGQPWAVALETARARDGPSIEYPWYSIGWCLNGSGARLPGRAEREGLT